MPKLAIDVALLPPKKIMDICIGINARAYLNGWTKDRLNKTNFFPHITLFMGTAEKSDLKMIKNILQKIANEGIAPGIILNRLERRKNIDGTRPYFLNAYRSKKLQNLHERVMKDLKKFLTTTGTTKMFFKKKNEEEPKNSNWLNQYEQKAAFKNFHPHITLRTEQASYEKLPLKFVATRLVLGHMGTSSTCRKILYEVRLPKPQST